MIGIEPIGTYPISTRTITSIVAATDIINNIKHKIETLDVISRIDILYIDTKLDSLHIISGFEDV